MLKVIALRTCFLFDWSLCTRCSHRVDTACRWPTRSTHTSTCCSPRCDTLSFPGTAHLDRGLWREIRISSGDNALMCVFFRIIDRYFFLSEKCFKYIGENVVLMCTVVWA